ncbi:ATP-dependent DNA helicase sgs1, partial [Ceratobasidium sp. 414]
MPEACSPFKKSILILDAQAGHSSETAQVHYAIDASETHRLATNTVAKEIAASARWWSVLIDAVNLTHTEINEASQAAITIAREDVLPLPPAPSIDSAAIRDAVKSAIPDITSMLLLQFEERFPALSQVVTHPPHSAAGGRFRPAPPVVVETSHLDILRRFRNDMSAMFRSKGQGQAFVHVVRRTASVLCVLATGGGKSMLFASMPVVEHGITIVIFPLRAVLADQVEASGRAAHLSPFQCWKYGQHFEDGIVAVPVETAATPGFAAWLTGINSQNRLNRIVFDEAHMLVTEQSYRMAMLNLNTLIEQGVPLVCLTATLPPSMLPDLQNTLGFPTFYVVRESTLRSNIAMHTSLLANRAHALSALVRHATRFQSELKPQEGIMVQCRYRAETEDIAKLISKATGVQTHFYHGGINQSDKDEVAFRWIAGKDPIIVCTSGLGSGVNHPSCRAVLHFGPPYGMTDYAQEVGRAGRDGLPSIAILFAWNPLPPVLQPDVKGYSHLHDILVSGDCVQYRLTRYLDGDDLAMSCSGSGGTPCGPCKS